MLKAPEASELPVAMVSPLDGSVMMTVRSRKGALGEVTVPTAVYFGTTEGGSVGGTMTSFALKLVGIGLDFFFLATEEAVSPVIEVTAITSTAADASLRIDLPIESPVLGS